MSKPHRRALIGGTTILAGIAAGLALTMTGTSSGAKFDATDPFSVFADSSAVVPPSDLAAAHGFGKPDFAKTREPARSLGRFGSRLLMFPSNADHSVCYALMGEKAEDPAAGYCFTPRDPSVPAGLAAEHFSALPLESNTDLGADVQVFGIAFDDVIKLRLEVDGQWRPVVLVRNGFYIDLPGYRTDQLGYLEATLKDGRVQLHDMRTGTSAR
jgi:hypothetical protein